MTRTAEKMLAAICANPGRLWYDVGAIAYPNSTKPATDLTGAVVRDLCGRGLYLAHTAVLSLEDASLVRRDERFLYYAVEKES